MRGGSYAPPPYRRPNRDRAPRRARRHTKDDPP